MDKIEILNIVKEICSDIFNIENLDIVSNTNSTDIDQWDSLNHLNLMSSIEEEFNIKFDFEEIGSLKNIGDIVKIVSEKL
jgi:acyl carrier protein